MFVCLLVRFCPLKGLQKLSGMFDQLFEDVKRRQPFSHCSHYKMQDASVLQLLVLAVGSAGIKRSIPISATTFMIVDLELTTSVTQYGRRVEMHFHTPRGIVL